MFIIFKKQLKLLLSVCAFVHVCVSVSLHLARYAFGGQRTDNLWGFFFPSIMLGLRTELGPSGSVAFTTVRSLASPSAIGSPKLFQEAGVVVG